MPIPIENRYSVQSLTSLATHHGWKLVIHFSKQKGWYVKIPGEGRKYVHAAYDDIVNYFLNVKSLGEPPCKNSQSAARAKSKKL